MEKCIKNFQTPFDEKQNEDLIREKLKRWQSRKSCEELSGVPFDGGSSGKLQTKQLNVKREIKFTRIFLFSFSVCQTSSIFPLISDHIKSSFQFGKTGRESFPNRHDDKEFPREINRKGQLTIHWWGRRWRDGKV